MSAASFMGPLKMTDRLLCDISERPGIWSAHDTHYVQQLIRIIATTEKRNTRDHLGENATTRPDIDAGGVGAAAEQNIRSAIPKSHDLQNPEDFNQGVVSSGHLFLSIFEKIRTSLENVLTGTPKARARPKSPSFNSPLRLMRRFWGFKSRCSTRFAWQ